MNQKYGIHRKRRIEKERWRGNRKRIRPLEEETNVEIERKSKTFIWPKNVLHRTKRHTTISLSLSLSLSLSHTHSWFELGKNYYASNKKRLLPNERPKERWSGDGNLLWSCFVRLLSMLHRLVAFQFCGIRSMQIAGTHITISISRFLQFSRK